MAAATRPPLQKSRKGSINSDSSSSTISSQRNWNALTFQPQHEWLFKIDLMYKAEVVAAIGDELKSLGITAETVEKLGPGQSPKRLQQLAKQATKCYTADEPHKDADIDKQLRLLHNLDQRLRGYENALSRDQASSYAEKHYRSYGSSHISRSSTLPAGASPSPRATKTEGTWKDSATSTVPPSKEAKVSSVSSKASKEPDGPTEHDMGRSPPSLSYLIACAVLSVLFIIGGMVGLYFETEIPKRIGLVIFLVTLLIILLTAKRVRPMDIFLLAAAYSAVLVVFLSGDLAGPQAVVVVDVANGANLAGAFAPQTSNAPAISGQATAATVNPAVGTTLSTVVTPIATATSATAPTEASTTAAAEQPGQPTQAQQDASSASGKIAGIIVGAIVAAMVLALLGPMLWHKIRSRTMGDGQSVV